MCYGVLCGGAVKPARPPTGIQLASVWNSSDHAAPSLVPSTDTNALVMFVLSIFFFLLLSSCFDLPVRSLLGEEAEGLG